MTQLVISFEWPIWYLDEDMFEELQRYDIKHKYAISVSKKKASFATHYVENQRAVIELLQKLAEASK